MIRAAGMWRDLVTVVTAVTAGDVSAQISPAQEDHSDHGLTAAELTPAAQVVDHAAEQATAVAACPPNRRHHARHPVGSPLPGTMDKKSGRIDILGPTRRASSTTYPWPGPARNRARMADSREPHSCAAREPGRRDGRGSAGR